MNQFCFFEWVRRITIENHNCSLPARHEGGHKCACGARKKRKPKASRGTGE